MTTQIEMSLESETWIDESVSLIHSHWPPGSEITADDLHGVVREPPHKNAYGKLFAEMAASDLIEHIGYTKSHRKERNGGLIRVWRVK